MAHPDDVQAVVRRAYVYDRFDLAGAAAKAGVSESTARRWRLAAEASGDDWDRARSAARLAGSGQQHIAEMILNDYLALHQAVIEDVKSASDLDPLKKAEVLSRLADAFTKTMAAVAKASPQLCQLAVATDVLRRLVAYAETDHPDRAPAVAEVVNAFAVIAAQEYG